MNISYRKISLHHLALWSFVCFILFLSTGCIYRNKNSLTAHEAVTRETKMKSLLAFSVSQLRIGDEVALDRAYATLELARELDPNDARVFDGLGSVEWRREGYKLAEFYFKKAVSLDPNYSRPYAHLSLVAERNGDYQAAKELLLKSLELNPLNYRARNNYAALLVRYGNQTSNEQTAYYEFLKVARGASKEDPVLQYNLGRFE